MSRKKNIWTTAIGLLLLVCIAAAAWQMPGIVYSFSDKSAFAKREEIHMELRQYEKEGSFSDRLYSLALCNGGACTMQSVRMKEEEDVDKEELTKVIQGELTKMSEAEVLGTPREIRAEDFVSCELYMSYVNSWDEKETRQGVAFWKIHYLRPQGEADWYDMEIIMDMEYHKIYDITVKNTEIEKKVQDIMNMEAAKKERYFLKTYVEECWAFMDMMLRGYYELHEMDFLLEEPDVINISSNTAATEQEMKQLEQYAIERAEETERTEYRLRGMLRFWKQKVGEEYFGLHFVKEYGYEEDGTPLLHIGIVGLEQILQL